MPIDDRSDLDRLSRHQLYMEAAAQGIQHKQDLPKYVYGNNGAIIGGMVSLLESHGVNRQNMKTVRWSTVYPSEQERAAAAHQGMATSEQHYPERPLSQSQRDGVDSSALLQQKLDAAETRETAQVDENRRLKEANAALEARLAALEARFSDPAAGARPPRKRGRKVKAHVEVKPHVENAS